MELEATVLSLADLPEACILTALLFLDVRDALLVRRTCHRINCFWSRARSTTGCRACARTSAYSCRSSAYPELACAGCGF